MEQSACSLNRSVSQLLAVERYAEANQMNEIGRKLLIIRQQRKLSLRQVEKLTIVIANRYGDKARRISASWLGRIERESHSIAHKKLESLEEVYGVIHDELTDETVPEDEAIRSLHLHFPDVPATVLKGLTGLGKPLLPPEELAGLLSGNHPSTSALANGWKR
jgi:transcriptional regulator with XRE-family HTH domain